MDLQSYLRVVRQRWWIVLATVTLALGVAALATVRATPQYTSTVTFFVTIPSKGVSDAYQGGLFLQQRVKSYADLLTSDRLAQSVVAEDSLGLTANEVQSRVKARAEVDRVLLSATVTDTDPARALKILEELTSQFVRLVQQIETPPGADEAPIKLEVVSGPRSNPNPVSPRPVRNLTLGGLLGLLLGVGLAVLRGRTDKTIRDGATLSRSVAAPLLGQIPYDDAATSTPLITGGAAQSPRAEALRKLRTNLRFVDVAEPARVIAVTSAVQGEGKSTLACNLSIALAEAGWRVLLIDADLRRPRTAHYLGIEGVLGLTDVLTGEVELDDVLRQWGNGSLHVLPGGSSPPNPSELLGSKAMADLLNLLRDQADIVVIDTAPLLPVADGVVVAVQADGALLVSRQGKTSFAEAITAAQSLQAVGARLLGCVLNMVKSVRSEVYQYQAYRVAELSRQPVAAPVERVPATAVGMPGEQLNRSALGEATHEFSDLSRSRG
ncbi:polysaccharide biosynthesis tyrosine autokinase [Micromonospora sp. NPDC049559]|uniref:polysaccharide biosynthesis tyrosine autokinase n=1 Tax=Micromonospora sp. NPDC049559 TaxID=3155923 RepID=UPI00342A736F